MNSNHKFNTIIITTVLFTMLLFTVTNAAETESETSIVNLRTPKSISGDKSMEEQFPAIEAQVEEQLSILSKIQSTDVENMINTYNRQINYSDKNVANCMLDYSSLSEQDDATTAMVKMLGNWKAVMNVCGSFEEVEDFTVDVTDQIMTMYLVTKYSTAEKNDTAVSTKFTYDIARNITLIDWEVKEGLYDTKVWKGSDVSSENKDNNIWFRIEELESRIKVLESGNP